MYYVDIRGMMTDPLISNLISFYNKSYIERALIHASINVYSSKLNLTYHDINWALTKYSETYRQDNPMF